MRLTFASLPLLVLGACSGVSQTVDDGNGTHLETPGTSTPLPIEVDCFDAPPATPTSWNHPFKSPLIAAKSPRHRIIDLITSVTSPAQTIGGRIAYGLEDKSLEQEDVEVFACMGTTWRSLGIVTTDDDGRFSLFLDGDASLPLGMRALSVVVLGDLSAVNGLALVAGAGANVAVSDVDGTLTSSENAYPESLVTGDLVLPNDGAPEALSILAELGYPLVYVTSRGDAFTQDSRDWLASNGFPLGPMRLAQSIVTLPGQATIDYKSGVLKGLTDGGLTVAIGIGNRASDQKAYASAHVAPSQTFLKIPEFISEVQPLVDAGLVVPNPSYVDIQPTFAALPHAP